MAEMRAIINLYLWTWTWTGLDRRNVNVFIIKNYK